jgi:glycosyltransferase involved in cell wall biosynthesis
MRELSTVMDQPRLNILHMVFTRVGQGSYWRIYHFGRHLAQRGHMVTLMATSPDRRTGLEVFSVDGMTLVSTPDLFRGSLRSGWDPWNTLHRLAWLRNHSFDIVYAIEARPTVIYPALYLQRVKHIPLVLGWSDWFGRGGSVEERSNPLVRAVLRPIETYYEERFRTIADATTVICTTLRDRALQLNVRPETIRWIPDGCDERMFQTESIPEARRSVHLPPGEFIIGYVGSIFQGDAELMASALDRVFESHPDVRLLIVGYCRVNFVELTRYPQAVVQTGPVSQQDLHHYLAACDLFWLPLRDTNANRGRWPHKLNDYMAIGRPIVATSVGDVNLIFEWENIGLLSIDQPGPFAEQTIRLLEDEELRIQMGQSARNLARTRFDWSRFSDELEALYFEVIQTREKK